MLETGTDSSVIIVTENKARIIGPLNEEIGVTLSDSDTLSIAQDGSEVFMDRDEAEALFLVLGTMLHPEE